MKPAVIELREGVYWVGVKDWGRRIFDGLIPLPRGTSYNAYLVKGGTKTALVDTVNPGFEAELLAKIDAVADPAGLDYVIMNHAEPDHAGAIPTVLAAAPRARLVLTAKGADLAVRHYRVPQERMRVVKEGDTLDLGGKTLRFVDAPFLHWPETMFTYLVEDEVLFPCDFFGAHIAAGMYDEEVPDLPVRAQMYFGEIMMPFRKAGERAIEKLADLPIELIAPSHGPLWRHPERILSLYRKWTAGETLPKVVVAYVSMWGSTERLVRAAVEVLLGRGVQVAVHELAHVDVGDLAGDLVDARAIVLGAPTVLGGLHPAALSAVNLVKALKPPLRYAAVVSSYGWGGGALRQAGEILAPTGIEVVGAVEVHGAPDAEAEAQAAALAGELAGKIHSPPAPGRPTGAGV
ncbi:MAG TPA: FprA family A-type flavoprotein [Candidatus Acetothermia bacterium]|nr:FprA family A-type flavoprotein [Candidatus Acetothermia bacterium]